MDPLPSPVDVDRIAAVGDPVWRNLQITHCYYQLSQALARRIGSDANWCTFATWASRQAGQTIRKDDLTQALEPIRLSAPLALPAAAEVAQFARKIGASLPAVLQQIDNSELRALLQQIDPTPDSLSQTGALDWADLPDRLHFSADLFRCYAVSPELFEPPFTSEQMADLQVSRMPGGPL